MLDEVGAGGYGESVMVEKGPFETEVRILAGKEAGGWGIIIMDSETVTVTVSVKPDLELAGGLG